MNVDHLQLSFFSLYQLDHSIRELQMRAKGLYTFIFFQSIECDIKIPLKNTAIHSII